MPITGVVLLVHPRESYKRSKICAQHSTGDVSALTQCRQIVQMKSMSHAGRSHVRRSCARARVHTSKHASMLTCGRPNGGAGVRVCEQVSKRDSMPERRCLSKQLLPGFTDGHARTDTQAARTSVGISYPFESRSS